MLRTRLATAAVALPLLLWLIFWAPFWAFRAVVLLLTLLALVEYFHMAFRTSVPLQSLGVAGGACVALAMGTAQDGAGFFSATVMLVVVLGLVSMLLVPEEPGAAVGRLGHLLLGVLYAGAFLPHFIWLRAEPEATGPSWVLFVLAVSMAGDTGGYFAGRFYGKHPLMPSVSPKKTVEGALGAVAANVVAGSVVKLLQLPGVSWAEILLLSVAAGILAQVGDLCESLLKRAFGAKDSGWLLPGHGGLLDRADSLVFPIVFVYYYVNFLRLTA